MVFGAGTDRQTGDTRRHFSVQPLDSNVTRLVQDAELFLYAVVRLGDLARRLDAELLVIGRATPPLSMKSVGAASKVRTVYHAGPYLLLFSNSGISTCGTGLAAIQSGSTRGSGGAAIAVERGASSWSTGPASSSRGQTLSVDLVDDRIGKRRESSEPVSALMLRCFHEEYDPRSRHAGGD